MQDEWGTDVQRISVTLTAHKEDKDKNQHFIVLIK